MFAKPDRHQPEQESNNGQSEHPGGFRIHELFEYQAEQNGGAVALVFEHQLVTYEQLNARANQLAQRLIELGVGPEIPVGICLDRSIELIVGVLAILKAGGAYLPLEPSYPEERLSLMMRDTAAPLIITQRSLVTKLPKYSAKTICLDEEQEMTAVNAKAAVTTPRSVDADNLAYLSYTSGSTGTPKAVGITHRNIVRLVKQSNYFSVSADDIFLQLAPLAFDASTFEIWAPLLNGATLVIYSSGSPSFEDISQVIVERKITTLWLTADLFHQMVEHQLDALSQVRQLLAGGDVLSVRHVKTVLDRLQGGVLINGYGPTENTTFTCCYSMRKGSRIESTVPIGQPIGNTQTYVLDSERLPVEQGELYVGGDGLARGYYNRPDLTAEKFIPNPFSSFPGARLYKTGDQVRLFDGKNLEFLGRTDNQVKIRGYRIEPEEIETALRKQPNIQDAVVVVLQGDGGDKRLIAYVRTSPPLRQPPSDLRNFLREVLPGYMVPSDFVVLEQMPLKPSGKIDRHALLEDARARTRPAEDYVAPRGEIEEILADIWAEVLGIEKAGRNDDLFQLGGHSLTAGRVASRVRREFKIELPLSVIFEASTVAALALVIERRAGGGQDSKLPLIEPIARDADQPLSFSQERVWFLQQLVPANRAYQFQATLRFRGELKVDVLERSLSELTRRHEILRTTFPSVGGRPLQRIHTPQSVKLPLIDLEGSPRNKLESRLQQLIREETEKPLNLTELPLIRWVLVRLDSQEHVLIHVEHHLLHDGWSFNVLIQELLSLYKAFSEGQPSPLPEPRLQFADFAVWQRRWIEQGGADAQLAYWKEKLGGGSAIPQIPWDYSRPPIASFRGGLVRVAFPIELCGAVRNMARREGCSLFMLMVSVFFTLLYRYSEQDEIDIGTGIANRRWAETEGMLGMIINNIALRMDLSGDPTFRELLKRARKTTLEAYENQDVPFDRVVAAVRPERSLSMNPLFQIFFSFHESPFPGLNLPGLTVEILEGLSNGSAKFDLSVIVIPNSEQRANLSPGSDPREITMLWEYSNDIIDASTVARAVRHYQNLVSSILENPDKRLSQLQLLSDEEQQQLLIDWNKTQASHSLSAPLKK